MNKVLAKDDESAEISSKVLTRKMNREHKSVVITNLGTMKIPCTKRWNDCFITLSIKKFYRRLWNCFKGKWLLELNKFTCTVGKGVLLDTFFIVRKL